MISAFRNMSNSKVGMAIIIVIGAVIVFSFAMADISNVGVGGGARTSNLAEAGGEPVTDRQMSDALEQELARQRQQNPEADYPDLDPLFDPILESLITERALQAFAKDNGFILSKRLIDAEIARLPNVTGADGKFSDAAYRAFLSQARLTDAQIRDEFRLQLLNRLMLVPVAAEVRVPNGIARPYASMLLERREAEVVMVPAAPFAAGIDPTDEQIQGFYRAQAVRYMVPEQRVLRFAAITPDSVSVAEPSEAEITASLNARASEFSSQDIRVISQVVLPDEATAVMVADAAREGSFADAVAPQGFSAADVSVGPQTREQFEDLTSEGVAAAVFANSVDAGSIVGPVRSSFGWHVVRVDSIRSEGGTSPAEARAQVIADLRAAQRQASLSEKVADFEDLIRDGASFTEAAAETGLTITETPAITASGRDLDNPDYRLPDGYQQALTNGFQMFAGDDPEVAVVGEDEGFVMVAVGDIIEAAPAPLAEIRDRVRQDLIEREALAAARRVATAIQQAMAGGASTSDAVAKAEADEGIDLPAVREIEFRRMDLAQFQGNVPAPVQMMFNLTEGQSRVTGGATNEGIYVVKTVGIERGDATTNPGLVSQTSQGFRQVFGNELTEQFLRAVREDVGVSRNESVIAATRQRITGGGQ
ncbi:peptidylprolyl isomerase [Sphingomicrobium clamense]|uniref:SurA N-terminal domain-containing protein n=1 Tax=Sphingomicrobium clamense TaxID=2851013 RepID=A0ABS6V5U8_9SPHN|nr:peptidylprolyl isomerase [Sphingomicrobium sp. B8]MBW0144944.1 SurA N-terminal domain-containing protein [Sphingomicrobium sp. B8]